MATHSPVDDAMTEIDDCERLFVSDSKAKAGRENGRHAVGTVTTTVASVTSVASANATAAAAAAVAAAAVRSADRLVVRLRSPTGPNPPYRRVLKLARGTETSDYKIEWQPPTANPNRALALAMAADGRGSDARFGCERRYPLTSSVPEDDNESIRLTRMARAAAAAAADRPEAAAAAETHELAMYERLGLTHPNIIRLDMWTPPHSPVSQSQSLSPTPAYRIVYEWVERDLYWLFEESATRALPTPQIADLMYQILCAFAYAESKGVYLHDTSAIRLQPPAPAPAAGSAPASTNSATAKIAPPPRIGTVKVGGVKYATTKDTPFGLQQRLYCRDLWSRAPEHTFVGGGGGGGHSEPYPVEAPSAVMWSLGTVFYELICGHPPCRGTDRRSQWFGICSLFGVPPPELMRSAASKGTGTGTGTGSGSGSSGAGAYPPIANWEREFERIDAPFQPPPPIDWASLPAATAACNPLNHQTAIVASITSATPLLHSIAETIIFAYLPVFESIPPERVSADGRHLLGSMLRWNPQQRITYAEALKHPFFRRVA